MLLALTWDISRVMIKVEAVRERYRLRNEGSTALPRRRRRDADVARALHLVDVSLFCSFFNSHREFPPTCEATPTPTSYSNCFECLTNVFLALAAVPGSAASEVQADQ